MCFVFLLPENENGITRVVEGDFVCVKLLPHESIKAFFIISWFVQHKCTINDAEFYSHIQ